MVADTSETAGVRLDVWLDVACLFRTRAEAQKACNGGKVDVNGQAAKPHRQVRVGDELKITRMQGRRQMVVVRGLATRHVPRAEARQLYEDTTPPPTSEELAAREIERMFRAQTRFRPSGPPSKHARRELLRLKGR